MKHPATPDSHMRLQSAYFSDQIAPFLHDPDPGIRRTARRRLDLAARLAALGDPLGDCAQLLSPAAFSGAVWRLPARERQGILRELLIPPARKPSRTASENALRHLRQVKPVPRLWVAQGLTLPVLYLLVPATENPSDEDLAHRVRNATVDRDLVRLCLVAWCVSTPMNAALLRVALAEPGFAPENWKADGVRELARALRAFEQGEVVCRTSVGTDAEASAEPSTCSELAALDLALTTGKAAVDAARSAIEAGTPPAPADIDVLRSLSAVFLESRIAVAHKLGRDAAELPDDRDALAALMGDHRRMADDRAATALTRFVGLTGPAQREEALDAVRRLAAGLAERPHTWSEDERGQVDALVALADLVDAVALDHDDESGSIDVLTETARAGLPDPGLITVALRSRLVFAAEPQAARTGVVTEGVAATEPDVSAKAVSEAIVRVEAQGAVTAPPVQAAKPIPEQVDSLVQEPPRATDAPPTITESAASPSKGDQHRALDNEYRDTVPPAPARNADWATLMAELVGTGGFDLAHHLASTTEYQALNPSVEKQTALADALAALAYAAAVRTDASLLADRLRDRLDGLDAAKAQPGRVVQLLTVGAASRAAIMCGYNAYPLLAGIAAGLGDLPVLADVLKALAQGCAEGSFLGQHHLSALAPLTEAGKHAELSSAAAEDELTRVRNFNFVSANPVAARWWHRESGLIGRLLAVAAANRQHGLADISRELRRLSKPRELEAELSTVDRQVREQGTRPLEGAARNRILKSARESLDLVRQWTNDVRAAEAVVAGAAPHVARGLVELRRKLKTTQPRLDAELEAFADKTGDPEASGAALALRDQLRTTIALLDGLKLTGPEPDPALLLNVTLLRAPGMRLTEDGEPTGIVSAPDVAEAAVTDIEVALRRRLDAADFGGARLLAESAYRSDRPDANESSAQWFQAISTAQEQTRRELRDRINALSRTLDSAARHGRLLESDRSRLDAALAVADIDRSDLGAVDRELATIVDELPTCEDRAKAWLTKEIDEALRDNVGVVAEVKAAIEARLTDGDFATAEEYLLNARDGVRPPEGEHHDELVRFFPAVPDHLVDGLTDEVIEAAGTGGRVGPLDYGRLENDERTQVQRAFRRWRELRDGNRHREAPDRLRGPLRMIGIEYGNVAPCPGLPGTPQRRWMDLLDVSRTGDAVIPAFGSIAGDRLRLMLVTDRMDVRTILSWVRQDQSNTPVLVCLFGTLTAAHRRQLADECARATDKPILVLDDSAMAFLGTIGYGRMNAVMRLLPPFAAMNPYYPRANESVPPEMFYGRQAERAELADPHGTSLIYGGRQFGKSALLRATVRHVDGVDGQRAAYVCLPGGRLGSTEHVVRELWSRIGAKLAQLGIMATPRHGSGSFDAARISQAVRGWLGGDPRRSLLLLLDECDAFFEADAECSFLHTAALRDLMNDTERRFKVVFAGLHQVQRFAKVPNQPLAAAHLGASRVIGPLSAQAARNLLTRPMGALGIQFEDDSLVDHVLTLCYYQPKLLQLAGEAIVDSVLTRRAADLGSAEAPPYRVSREQLEAVLSAAEFRTSVSDAIDLTLNLDSRYKIIALVMAHWVHEGHGRTISTPRLFEECRNMWSGFAAVSREEFRALLEEMVGLGVLAREPEGLWRVRSSNVLRMLGSAEEVLDELCDLPEAQVTTLAAESWRTLLPGGRTSPLTAHETVGVLGEDNNQLRIVLGTRATAVDRVESAIRVAAESSKERFRYLPTRKAGAFGKALECRGVERGHLVVVDDLRDNTVENILEAVRDAMNRLPAGAATRAVTIVVDASRPEALMAMTDPDLATDRHNVVALRRLSEAGIRAWGTADGRVASFSAGADVRLLLEATGGWPILLDLIDERFAGSGVSAAEVCAQLTSYLATPSGAADFIDAVSVDSDARVLDGWRRLVEFDEPLRREDAVELVADGGNDAERVVDALIGLDLLCAIEARWAVEPVAARVWRGLDAVRHG